MTEITFVGTGEAFDADLPNTSILYRGGRTLLLDCGFAVPQALWRISEDPSLLDAVYLTHWHADHSFGLPALLLRMGQDGRSRPLTVLGGPGLERMLRRLLEQGYPGAFRADRCFAIEPRVVRPGEPLALGPITLRVAQSAHPVRNLAVRVDDAGRSLCYSGDGAATEATRGLYEGARALVHECHDPLPRTEGHADALAVLQTARAAGVERLYLVHVGRHSKEAVADVVRRWVAPPDVLVPAPGDRFPL